MDRLLMPGAMPAELAERMSDVGDDITDTDELDAVRSIVDDYLTVGLSYPRRGFPRVNAGDFIVEELDEDALGIALTYLIFGTDTQRSDKALELSNLCEEKLERWLREKHSNLVEQRIEELMEDKE